MVLTTVPGIMARHQAEARATAPLSEATPAAAPSPEATGTPASAQASPAPTGQQFYQYVIQPGDSISSIAAAFGVSESYILWNNPEVGTDPDFLVVGETLLIPGTDGLVYHVAYGDTLSDIAAAYGTAVEDILGFTPNNVGSADSVTEGMVLLIPGAVPPAPPPAPDPVPVPEPGPDLPIPAGVPAPAPLPPASSGFIWPFYGSLSSYFGEPRGGSYHSGIDIDGFGSYGAPIAAAASGIVVVAAWDDWGLGYHIIIDHGDGTRTVYGHLSEIWVTHGQAVGQGESIGALGSTGYSTGAHLHFEVHVNGIPVDPVAYLP